MNKQGGTYDITGTDDVAGSFRARKNISKRTDEELHMTVVEIAEKLAISEEEVQKIVDAL